MRSIADIVRGARTKGAAPYPYNACTRIARRDAADIEPQGAIQGIARLAYVWKASIARRTRIDKRAKRTYTVCTTRVARRLRGIGIANDDIVVRRFVYDVGAVSGAFKKQNFQTV